MKPLTVLEALVLAQVGWMGEEQRRLYVEALDVLHAAAEEIRAGHREYPERREITWMPSFAVASGFVCPECRMPGYPSALAPEAVCTTCSNARRAWD